MNYSYLGLLLILFSFFSNAQENEPKENTKNKYITFNPTTLIDPLKPRFRIGYIHDLSAKIGIGLDIGYGNENIGLSPRWNNTNSEYKLWEIRPQLFFYKEGKGTGISYFSLEAFFIRQTNVFDEGSFTEDEAYFRYEKANFQNDKLGLNFIFGVLSNKNRRLGFSFYTGLGAGIRINKHSNVVNLTELEEEPNSEPILMIFGNDYQIEGLSFILNITLGIKVDFRVNKTQNQ